MDVDLAPFESLLRASLPIGDGDRAVKLGSATPLIAVEAGRAFIAIETGGHDGRACPFDRLGERSLVVLRAWLAALKIVVREASGHWSFSAINSRLPLDLVPDGTIDDIVRVLLKPQWMGELVAPERRSPRTCELTPPSVAYDSDGSLDAQEIVTWWSAQLLVELDDAPREALVIRDLERFCSRVYNGGLESFLLQAPGDMIVRSYQALVEVGSRKLAERVAAGLGPARNSGAEFTYARFTGFPSEMKSVAPAPTLQSLDGHEYPGSWYLIDRELGPARTRFVRKHRAALVREAR